MPTIAAGLIVRDEAAVLAACLRPLLAVVDECVVVDTGSVDDTLALARSFNASCHTFAWRDDFAAARNFAIDHATADFVLNVDADEILEAPELARPRLEAFTAAADANTIGAVTIRSTTHRGDTVATSVDRMFKRGAFHYAGRIHEQPVAESGTPLRLPTGLTFAHGGYAQDPADPEHKAHRNLRLLDAALADDPKNEYLHYQRGKAWFALDRFPDAATALTQAEQRIDFDADPPHGSKAPVPTSVLSDLPATCAYCLLECGDTAAAEALLDKHERIAHPGVRTADFYAAKGYVLLQRGELARAQTAFERARALGPETETVEGSATFIAAYNLGLIREARADPQGAVACYAEALRLRSEYPPAIARIFELAVTAGADPLPPLARAPETAVRAAALDTLRRYRDNGALEQARRLTDIAGRVSPALGDACRGALAEREQECPEEG